MATNAIVYCSMTPATRTAISGPRGKHVETVDQSDARFTDKKTARRDAFTDQSDARFTDMDGASYQSIPMPEVGRPALRKHAQAYRITRKRCEHRDLM